MKHDAEIKQNEGIKSTAEPPEVMEEKERKVRSSSPHVNVYRH